jgi:hypothetical protein
MSVSQAPPGAIAGKPVRNSGMTTDETAEMILVDHQRHRGGCLCGWSELGKSHPGHQVAMLREAGLLNDVDAAVRLVPDDEQPENGAA